jgi:hypothetical protein
MLPFSDWFARVERAIERRLHLNHGSVHLPDRNSFEPYYAAGLSPLEAADDFSDSYLMDWRR